MMTILLLLHRLLYLFDHLAVLWTLCTRRLLCVDTVFISHAPL